MVLALAMMIGTMSFSDARDVKASTHVGTITAVGVGSGSFLNGANWEQANTSNDMTEIETDVWEITYMNVSVGTHEFKFAADHAWTVSFGTGASMDSGTSYIAYKGGSNSTFTVSEVSNVTLRLDLRNYDGNNGAKMAVLVVPVEEYELTGGGEAPLKETVTYNVTNMSFSGVLYKYQCCRYITTLVPMPGYELPDSIDISIAGTGNLTMGTGYKYDSITGAVKILSGVNNGAVTITAAAVEKIVTPVYTVAGEAGLCGVDLDPTANSMTSNGDGTYSITFTNVPAGAYGFKVTDGTFNNTWGDNDSNYNITVRTTCDVTINFNSSTKEITVSGSGIGSYVYSNMSIAGTGLFASDWTLETMTETSTGIWEYTVDDVAADTYSYKFTTDNSWTYSWGADGWYNSSENYSLTVPYDGSKVTFRVDLTGVECTDFGYNSENGCMNIPEEYVTGDIVITVSAVSIEEDDKLFINGTLTGGEFVEMTESDVNPGEFYYLITGKKGDKVKFKFTFTNAWEDEISASGGEDFELELTDDGTIRVYVNTNKLGTGSQNGNYVRYECEMNYGEAGTTAVGANVAVHAGDTTPYVAVAVIAVLALGIFILLASKKRIVTE